MRGLTGEAGRRLAIGATALSLMTGGMAWSAAQSPITLATASSCSSHSEGACDSKAGKAEDAKEAKSERQCRAEHTEKFCRDRARAEDRDEKATECEEEGDKAGNSDCEPYGGYGESGDNRLHIAQVDDAFKSLSNAGVDVGLTGTATSILIVVGTLLLVAVRRRRIGPPIT